MNVRRSPSLWPGLHQLAGTAPAINSPVRVGLRHRCRSSRPHQLTMPWPTHLSELPLMLRSSLSSVSRGLVYINIPGRTYLHELFIEYEQVTAWVARFFFQQNGGNYHILSTAVCTRWLNGHAHKLLPLQFGHLQTTSWKEPLAELLKRFIRGLL